jgi:SAM-dependent methyltransferase
MFVLSEETPFKIHPAQSWWRRLRNRNPEVHWLVVPHTHPVRMSLIVRSGSAAILPQITVARGEQLTIEYGAGLTQISGDGLDISVRFVAATGEQNELFSEHLAESPADGSWRLRSVSLQDLEHDAGHFEIQCGPGPENDPCADWLAVTEFLICRPEETSLARARMHPVRREKAEGDHFAQAYKADFYVKPKISAYAHADSIVMPRVVRAPLDFKGRLAALAKDREVRVLSLCAGAARIEKMLLEGLEDRVELTLFDINERLLEDARKGFSNGARVETILGDANTSELPVNRFDIVMCVSALHHIVELEHVVEQIARTLRPEGEFWSIGEYIGRNGARLWEESYAVANGIFRELPERFRRNRQIGLEATPEQNMPNGDCSVNTFEGVRAQEVESVLATRFEGVHVNRWGTILWRLLDPAYADNYDIDIDEDREIVERIAELDATLLERGELKPVSLDGVFRVRN